MTSLSTAGRWVAILVALGCGCPAARASIIFNTFTSPNGTNGSNDPIGFAYAGNKFVGSLYVNGGGNTFLYSTALDGSNVQPFGTSVTIPTSSVEEHYVASSLGLGGFPNRDIYVGAVGAIYHVTNNGASGGQFTTSIPIVGDVKGILFDAIGTFGHDMLVTTAAGNVYRVKSDGTTTLLANVGEVVEGLDVAPLGAAGPYSGFLFTASEGSGDIRAIDTSGNVHVVGNVPSAEELDFVPLNLGASGNSVEGFYAANFPADVQKAAANQFNGLQGDILVTSEFGSNAPIWDLKFNSGTSMFDATTIGHLTDQAEDGIFVTTAIIGQAATVPEPSTLLLLLSGCAGLGVYARCRRRAAA